VRWAEGATRAHHRNRRPAIAGPLSVAQRRFPLRTSADSKQAHHAAERWRLLQTAVETRDVVRVVNIACVHRLETLPPRRTTDKTSYAGPQCDSDIHTSNKLAKGTAPHTLVYACTTSPRRQTEVCEQCCDRVYMA
jgi:hypothetical protein